MDLTWRSKPKLHHLCDTGVPRALLFAHSMTLVSGRVKCTTSGTLPVRMQKTRTYGNFYLYIASLASDNCYATASAQVEGAAWYKWNSKTRRETNALHLNQVQSAVQERHTCTGQTHKHDLLTTSCWAVPFSCSSKHMGTPPNFHHRCDVLYIDVYKYFIKKTINMFASRIQSQ